MQKHDIIYIPTTWEKEDNTGFYEATIYGKPLPVKEVKNVVVLDAEEFALVEELLKSATATKPVL